MANIKVAIDAGHGSDTAGKRTPPFTRDVDVCGDQKIIIKKGQQYKEHFANVMVANKLTSILESYGIDILKTGWNDSNGRDDIDTSILERQRLIQKSNVDYVISIHFNASNSKLNQFDNAEGIAVYIRTEKEKREESEKFAQCVLEELIQGTSQKNRGICQDNLGMCNATGMNVRGAILIELAFMTNEREAQELMANEEYCQESAEEIARGFINYITGHAPNGIVTTTSNEKYIMWLQMMLNKALGEKLSIDGIYGSYTAKAVLKYFNKKGWDYAGKSGYYTGMGTINSLKKY